MQLGRAFLDDGYDGHFIPDGPVLDRTELYLLGTELMLNPILSDKSDQLQFHLVTGVVVWNPFMSMSAN